MGAGPIPWSKVQDWARDRGIDTPDERDEIAAIVAHLDGIWLKHMAARAAKAPPGKPPPTR